MLLAKKDHLQFSFCFENKLFEVLLCLQVFMLATAISVPIAMPRVCTKCFSLNLKEFSSSMNRISSRKSFVGIDNFCS